MSQGPEFCTLQPLLVYREFIYFILMKSLRTNTQVVPLVPFLPRIGMRYDIIGSSTRSSPPSPPETTTEKPSASPNPILGELQMPSLPMPSLTQLRGRRLNSRNKGKKGLPTTTEMA